MKIKLIVIVLLLLPFMGFSQSSTPKKSKKELKLEQKKQRNENLHRIHALLEKKSWVFKIESLHTLDASIVSLLPENNFLFVKNNIATLQLSVAELSMFDPTQLNEIMVDGDIVTYQVESFRENQAVICQIHINNPNNALVRVHISAMSDGQTTVIFTLNSGVNFTFSGIIETTDGKPVIPVISEE
tara:strand:+ start:77200 stop:77757 length:558 start_codon:yes stop_codon:yes gene_type:complete